MNYEQHPLIPSHLAYLARSWRRPPILTIVELVALAAAVLGTVVNLTGCASAQANPLNAAILGSRASVILVNSETATINAQVEADYAPRARACAEDPKCLTEAKVATRDKLGPRIALSLAAIEAQNRVADALDAAKKCREEDANCQTFYILAASAGEAEVALILARLRRTPPLPPSAPSPTSKPAGAPSTAPQTAIPVS